MGEVNLLSFRTEYSMEKTKESQDAPQREDDIHGVDVMGQPVASLVEETPEEGVGPPL